MSRKAWIAIGLTFGFLLFLDLQNRNGEVKSSRLFAAGPVAPSADLLLDVNDVSYLWPVPKTKDDVVALMSVDDKLADGTSQIWPLAAFNSVVQTAQTVTIQNSAGRINGIQFATNKVAFEQPHTWKIVAFRVDPSAPGCDPALQAIFGSTPQIRLIVQPVTVSDTGSVTIHDLTAHLVFSYVKGFDPSANPGGPARAIPDKDRFMSVVNDLRQLKTDLGTAGVATAGKLGVHPGLKGNVPGFGEKAKAFLKKNLAESQLSAIAFMGLDLPEPWIFFAALKQRDGSFARVPNGSFNGDGAQMVTFKGGTSVMPVPSTTNVTSDKGVSTAALFDAGIAAQLKTAVFNDRPRPLFADIPDIIANPSMAHFFNTDCISCHTESTRRKILAIVAGDGKFTRVRPAGISGVDEAALPTHPWNVRNFGWVPLPNGTVATVTMRTANEAADSADFINRQYLNPQK